MKVARIQLWHVEVPTTETFFPAWLPAYPQTDNKFTLLRIFADDGRSGVAAGPAFNREREGLGVLLGPYLLGTAIDDLATVRQRIREASFLGWRNPWIEMAFLDLWGQADGKAACELLGGARRPLPAYCSTGQGTTPENAADQVGLARRLGAKTVKVRAHAPTVEADRAMLAAAGKAAADAGADLAVDANQGWYVTATGPNVKWDLDRARGFAKSCADVGVRWLEEPLDMYDVQSLAALRKERIVPIAGGELVGDHHAFRPLFQGECLDVYQPDATLCGGAETSLKVAKACKQRGLAFSPHTWTNGWGLLYNAHILAASGSGALLEWPFDPPGWTPVVRDALMPAPLGLDDQGRFSLPDAPGLGAPLDEGALKRHGTRFYDATPGKLAASFVRQKGLLETFRYARRRKGG